MMSAISYLHVLSPLHTGTGQGTGVLDLPIARETTTNWPEIPGSGIKGALRSVATGLENFPVEAVFGPDLDKSDNASAGSGHVWFGGARILCFPVRSYAGTFAWITCPLALMSWQRDLETAGFTQQIPQFSVPNVDHIFASTDTALKSGSKVLLEEIDLTLSVNDETKTLATFLAESIFDDADWRDFFVNRFAIVDDEVFTFMVSMATTVTTRIRLEDTSKTVVDGAMWYEETIPPETIFCHPVTDTRGDYAADLVNLFAETFQLGGNATVGQGLVRASLVSVKGGE